MLIPVYADSSLPAEMSVGKTLPDDGWQMQMVEATSMAHQPISVYRDHRSGPLRKLSVDLIHTYKRINEVCLHA